MDDVLLVASSKSFAAVNREQFYVSISRGRESVHVFTDDSEALARRVTDSRDRKAAVELQALRDDLAKLGFGQREGISTAPIISPDFRTMRLMRGLCRVRRESRLTPVSRIAHAVQRIRQWLSETLADSRVAEIEKITTRDVTKEQEEIAPEIKETPKQTPQQTIRARVRRPIKQSPPQQQQQQRRSGGIHI